MIDVDALLELMTAAAVVTATVAGIRRTWTTLDGWRVVLMVVLVSIALCTSLTAMSNPALWYRGAIEGVAVAMLALGGDSYLSRLASKAGTTKRVEVIDSTAMVSRTGDSVSTGTPEIIPPAPREPTITTRD